MSDELEDWETADLVLPTTSLAVTAANEPISQDQSEWVEDERPPLEVATTVGASKSSAARHEEEREYETMYLVDLTVLSDGKIHNKFDAHSCNDPELKKKWCDKISAAYFEYDKNSKLISEGVIRHCSERVWRDALISLRNDHPGHFFAPIFRPKKA